MVSSKGCVNNMKYLDLAVARPEGVVFDPLTGRVVTDPDELAGYKLSYESWVLTHEAEFPDDSPSDDECADTSIDNINE